MPSNNFSNLWRVCLLPKFLKSFDVMVQTENFIIFDALVPKEFPYNSILWTPLFESHFNIVIFRNVISMKILFLKYFWIKNLPIFRYLSDCVFSMQIDVLNIYHFAVKDHLQNFPIPSRFRKGSIRFQRNHETKNK